MDRSKIIIVLTILLVLGGGSGLLYYSFYGGGSSQNTNPPDSFPDSNDTPGGNVPDDETNIPEDDTPDDTRAGNGTIIQISKNPIISYAVFGSGEEARVRFIEKERGWIFDYREKDGQLQQVSNNTLLGVQDVIWGPGGNEFITRSLRDNKTIETKYHSFEKENTPSPFMFTKNLKLADNNGDVRELQKVLNKDQDTVIAQTGAGSAGQEASHFGQKTKDAVLRFQKKFAEEIYGTSTAKGDGIVDEKTRGKLNELQKPKEEAPVLDQETQLFTKTLPENIVDIVASPKKDMIFYVVRDAYGSSRGIIAEFDNANQRKVFDLPFSEWILSWPLPEMVFMTTKASQDVLGATYSFGIKTGVFEKVLGTLSGLTSLPDATGKYVVYSQKGNRSGEIATKITNFSDKTNEVAVTPTFPEKCVWSRKETGVLYCAIPDGISSKGLYPDDWYKGTAVFSDRITLIDSIIEGEEVIFDPTSESFLGESDLIKLSLNEDENVLFFINKKDLTLWGVFLK